MAGKRMIPIAEVAAAEATVPAPIANRGATFPIWNWISGAAPFPLLSHFNLR